MKILQKIAQELADVGKSYWAHPANAPLTEPLKLIGKCVAYTSGAFFPGIRAAWTSADKSKPLPQRILNKWANGHNTDVMTSFSGIAGTAAGVLGGMFYVAPQYGLFAGMAATFGGAAVGWMTGPFVLVGALMLAGAVTGTVLSPLGAVKGVIKSVKHIIAPTRPAPPMEPLVAPVVPPVVASPIQPAPRVKTPVETMLETLRALDRSQQRFAVKTINEKFAAISDDGTDAAAGIRRALDVMPKEKRRAAIETLHGMIMTEFAAAVTDNAQDATRLKRGITPLKPARFAAKPESSTKL